MREGSNYLDPTRGMTPTAAARQRARFQKMIEESEERIRILKKRRDEFCDNINDKIERELTYIQEAELVINTLNDAFDPDYLDITEAIIHHDIDDRDDEKETEKEPKNEIILYGTPYY